MLATAIPSYRLPREIVQAEIQMIREMGVTMKTGVEVARTSPSPNCVKRNSGLFRRNWRPGVVSGSMLRRRINGVYSALDYLRQVNLENLWHWERCGRDWRRNVALDAVRSARRLGASNAFILYRRGLEEMPSRPDEIEACRRKDHAPFPHPTGPEFMSENGRSRRSSVSRHDWRNGRRAGAVHTIPGSEFTVRVRFGHQRTGQGSGTGVVSLLNVPAG